MSSTTDPGDDSPLVTALRDQVGEALRSVSRYRKQEYRIRYLRPDVEERYTPDDVDAAFDDLVLQGMHKDLLEDLFEAGRLECSMLKFEEALMFHFVGESTEGLFVTLDSGVEANVEDLAATCKEHL